MGRERSKTGSSKSFHSFNGFYSFAPDFAQTRRDIENLIEESHRNHFLFGQRKAGNRTSYRTICLADTFLSDTWDYALLSRLIEVAKKEKVRTQILLLNPESEQAIHRAAWLEADTEEVAYASGGIAALGRSARGLSLIGKTVSQIYHNSSRSKLPTLRHGSTIDAEGFNSIAKSVGKIVHQSSGLVEVRLTEYVMELPFFIIGDSAFRGLLSQRESSADSPWMQFVDHPGEVKNIFRVLQGCFTSSWKLGQKIESFRAQPLASNTAKNIIIAYSESHRADFRLVQNLITDIAAEFRTVHFNSDDIAVEGDSTVERVERLLEQSCAGVVLAMHDELVTVESLRGDKAAGKRVLRSRPNVIHELGLLQARFGRKRLLVLTEGSDNYELPSNINGLVSARVDRQDDTLNEVKLKEVLRRFIENLRRDLRSRQVATPNPSIKNYM